MIFPLILALTMIVALALLGRRFAQVRRAYYVGVAFWSRWLPVVATAIFMAVICVNLLGSNHPAMAINRYLSTNELLFFLVCAPFFLTRVGNLLAAACLVYSAQRLFETKADMAASLGLHLLVATATIVTVLGDKVPWFKNSPSRLANMMREILLVAVTIGFLAIVFTGIIKIYPFAHWFNDLLGITVPSAFAMAALTTLFIGWMSVALGFTRHFTIPLLTLPTLFVLAFVTEWPTPLLIIPFTLSLALSLATAERRAPHRTYQRSAMATTYALPR